MSEGAAPPPVGPVQDLPSAVGFVVHDGSGRILHTGQAFYLAAMHLSETEPNTVIGTGAPESHYVAGGEVVERPLLEPFDKTTIAADSVDEATIALPVPATVTVDDEAVELPAGEFRLAAETPGTYRVTVSAFPYRELSVEIIAT